MFSNTRVFDKLSEHSVNSPSTDNSLDSLSAPMFFTQGVWAAIVKKPFLSAHSQIEFMKW